MSSADTNKMNSHKPYDVGMASNRPYGKAILITGGVLLAVWAARKVPWKKLVSEDTMKAVCEGFANMTSQIKEIALDYIKAPAADLKKIASRAASSVENAPH